MTTPTLGAVMTWRPITLEPDELADVALTLMLSCRFHHLPVVRHGLLLGMVSARDLLREPVHASPVEKLMKSPMTAHRDTPVPEAIERMIRERISCLVIVEGTMPIGVVTRTDLLSCTVQALRADEAPGRVCPVSRLMTHPPIRTITATGSVAEAFEIMTSDDLRHLPVLAGERLVGMLSDHDLLAAARTGDPLVGEVMSKRVITVGPEDRARDAAEVLHRRRIGALPVVVSGRLCGMLSVSDFFHYLASLSAVADVPASRRARAGHRRS